MHENLSVRRRRGAPFVRFAALLAACLALLPWLVLSMFQGSGAADPERRVLTLTVGSLNALDVEGQTELREIVERLGQRLEVSAGYVEVETEGVEGRFARGDVLVAWMDSLAFVRASARVPGARAIAEGVEDRATSSAFIAHRDAHLEARSELESLRELSFAFGPERSLAGHLMPEHFLRQQTGRTSADLFRRAPVFTASDFETLAYVAKRRVDAGVVKSASYELATRTGRVSPVEVRVVWRSPAFPDSCFAAHPALETQFGAGFIDRLQEALCAIEEPVLLSALRRTRLVPAREDDLAPLRAIADELGASR